MAENKTLNIYQKLLEIQKELDYLKLDEKGQNYDYVKGSSLLSKIRPRMDKLGLLLFQEIISTDIEHVIWKTKYNDKQQTFAHVKFKFTWVDTDSKETIEHLFESSGFNDWDKAVGSAMTYGERYYLLKQFHIPTDKLDPDARKEDVATENPVKEHKTLNNIGTDDIPEVLTPWQILEETCTKFLIDIEEVKKKYEVDEKSSKVKINAVNTAVKRSNKEKK